MADEHAFLVPVRPFTLENAVRDGDQIRAVHDIDLAVIHAAEVAVIHPHMVRRHFPGRSDADVIPAEIVVLAAGIEFPKVAEAEIADDHIFRAFELDRATPQRRTAGRPFERRVRTRVNDAGSLEFLARVAIGEFPQINIARQADRPRRGIAEFFVGDVEPFELALKFERGMDDDGLCLASAGGGMVTGRNGRKTDGTG